ncbi:MAG: hypothetical protein PHW32_00535 [Bacilli bacterium]|nr:hypothetical protein [Bacilli bacterium]MDD4282220.1 hypothetical protein [Bacilli bacterium]MDD4718219.1 hypothetical protein [Bacilli bacterium]
MERINLVNVNNEILNANVIRYFALNNSNYLIYSLNEVDEQNYVKLYAIKVDSQNGVMVSSNVTDENDWLAIKELIKVIIRGNKNGVAEVADLNYNELESLQVTENRVFKLSKQLTELLSANKKEFVVQQPQVELEPVTIEPIQTPEVSFEPVSTPNLDVESTITPLEEPKDSQPNAEVDYYKNLYQQEKVKNEELTNKLNEIKKFLD